MLNSEEISRQITSEDEALVVLCGLGFNIGHGSFIKKVGGARAILAAGFLVKMLAEMGAKCEIFSKSMGNIRAGLDDFYASGGFLVSPNTHPKSRLFKVSSAPLVFFGRYHQKLLNQSPGVAIVGSRNADLDALEHTRNLSSLLAQQGVNVISGGAMGVDAAAHLGAHEALGATTLICGRRCNFRDAELPDEFACISPNKLLVLHPYGPFFPQKNYMFVTRNQFVAALCDHLVVVQGLAESGTSHTANYARALNIPIFAIPGSLNNPKSFVPNQLLERGFARALVDFEQFAASLVAQKPKTAKNITKIAAKPLGKELPPLLKLIRENEGALTMDELMALSGKSLAECQFEVLEYELAGRIIKRGAQFVLNAQ